MSRLDRMPRQALSIGSTVPQLDDSKGINREHGAEDPIGTKTVAAPATVSGLPSIVVRKHQATASSIVGRQMDSRYPRARRPAVTEEKPQRTGCSDGKDLA